MSSAVESLKPYQENSHVLGANDIRRDPSSYVDPHGYVIHHEGEIYRYIHPDSTPFYNRLIEEGVLDRLQSQGLVGTRRCHLSIADEEEGMVLHHDRVHPLSYCVEWCPSMLRDAGLVTIDLSLAAVEDNLMLQDAYPWNVLFEGTRPVFVDVTSLVEGDRDVIWPAHEQFEAYFTRPLKLAAQSHGKVGRGLLYNNLTGIDLQTFYQLTSTGYHLRHPSLMLSYFLHQQLQKSTSMKNRVRKLAESMEGKVTPQMRRKFLQRLRRQLESYRTVRKADPWGSYYAEIGPEVDRDAKVRAIRQLITQVKPTQVLDLGCNAGVFSMIAAQCGARVISVDSSEPCIEQLYAKAKQDDLHITPIMSDVLCPTPAYGFMGTQYARLWDRAKSDMVMCLGLMHHLHMSGRQSWERIVELLSTVSTKHLIFEYVGMDDANIDHLPHRRTINYTLESVASALRTKFKDIEIHDSDRDSRKLLLCTK